MSTTQGIPCGLDVDLFSHHANSSYNGDPPFRKHTMEILDIVLKHLEAMEEEGNKDGHVIASTFVARQLGLIPLLKDFKNLCSMSFQVLHNKGQSVNEFGRRVFEMVSQYGNYDLRNFLYGVVMSKGGCLVEVYEFLLMTVREEKNVRKWSEVDLRMLYRVLSLIEQHSDFQDVLMAHADLTLCFELIHCATGNKGNSLVQSSRKTWHTCCLKKKKRKTDLEIDLALKKNAIQQEGGNILWNMCANYEFCGCIYTYNI